MLISVVNHTVIPDEEVLVVLRAINRQVEGDFAPYWGMSAQVRLEGRSGTLTKRRQLEEMRGEAVLYLWDTSRYDEALGYHDKNHRGIPFGFVFTELAKRCGEPWSVTLSHEVLELVADPEANLLVAGPRPDKPEREVFHWYEVCDAVQAETYTIDMVAVSNFVLPLYFTREAERGGRNDFLRRRHGGRYLESFGVNPGGYVGYYDPASRDHVTYWDPDDAEAADRSRIKSAAKLARRSMRYRQLGVAKRRGSRAAGSRRRT